MKLPDIAGKFTTPKPWQIAAGIGVVIVGVIVLPAITHVLVGEKKKQAATALQHVASPGEPWHPVSFPPPQKPTPPPVPPQLAVLKPPQPPPGLAPPSLAATKPTKEAVDPEQEAINSPILIGGGAPGEGGRSAEREPAPRPAPSSGSEGSSSSAMAGLLKPTELPGFRATIMKHPETTIAQGTIIQCKNVTPITSGLPGFVTARTRYDIWSADQTIKLIEHDSTMFGEIGHGLANGQERLFVLWRQITTPPPNSVRITLNSPAADEMGEAGLSGDINHHYREKIGSALLLSGIESLLSGASGYLSNLGRSGNNNNSQGLNLNFSQASGQGSNLASQLLSSTITIPDTMHIDQASACSAFASGDLDFSSIYSITRRR